MAQLLSLSNEILLEILSYSYDSHSHRRAPSLARIVFTCRRLHALAINILLERVDLDCTTKQYSKFLRAIKTNPTLGPKVRFLDLQWNDFLCRKSDPQELLRRLPHLQCLSMKVMQSYKLDSLSYALSPSQRLGRCFYKMNIHLEKPSSRDLPDLLLINQVHVLEATIPRINNICPVPVAERFQARTAPLQSFTTLGATKISTYNLHNLLTYPKALTHLAIALPGTEDRSSAGRTTIAQMDGPVAPSAIARSLLPATISLQSLEIHGHMQYFDGHDGTRLSLCQFTALETATLSSRLFFSDDASADPTGFYALLPPSIREITLNFDFPSSIPRNNALTWLSEIADHHKTHTPRLRLVQLYENENPLLQRHGSSAPQEIEIWKVPEELRRAFEREGVEVRGRVTAAAGH